MPLRYRKILFVEDNILLNMENCEFLRVNGFNVAGAYSAASAFSLLESHVPLSAVVIDINLGAGSNGFDVARRARSIYPNLPVIFISGTAPAQHLTEGIDRSIFIAKPFHPRQIFYAINHATGDNPS